MKLLEKASVLPAYFGGETIQLYRETKAIELAIKLDVFPAEVSRKHARFQLYRETKAIELARFKKLISAEEYEWYL